MKKKLFLLSLATTISLPAIVAPVQAQEVSKGASQDFKDVSKNHSAYKEITAMRDFGIIDGYPDNTFKPEQSISRVHVASLLDRILNLPSVRAGKEFKDVPKTSPYYEAVQSVYRAGIFDGDANGTFGINDNLTRAQMAKVMVNAFKLDIHKGTIFTDVSTEHWATDYISSLYMSGITVGSNGKYMPNEPVSRANYAVFLYRALHPSETPKPEIPLSKPPVEGNPFPSGPISVPSGWTESKTKEHDKTIADTVFQYAPKKGTGSQFGTSTYTLDRFDDPQFRSDLEKSLEDFYSSVSINEWYDGVNEVIKSGGVYIAPDYSFGVYIVYYKSTALIKFTR